MAKLLDPNFASQPCDRLKVTQISLGFFHPESRKRTLFYLKNKKELQKKRLSQGPQILMSLMSIDGHSDLHQYQRQKDQSQNKSNQSRAESEKLTRNQFEKKIVIGYRDTMTEDRTSAQNVGPQDRTSSSGGPSPSPSSTTSLFISIVTSFIQLNTCVRRRSRRMIKIELVLVFRNRWLYIYVINIWHSLQRKQSDRRMRSS